jgi:colanic acid biosynthesis glycosyl transferase WcaI
VQDFELEAAFATGLVSTRGLMARLGSAIERFTLQKFDLVSSISPQMVARLHEKGVPVACTYELRNWADIERVHPLTRPSLYRDIWGIATPHVALYSGNIANKQGIEVVLEAARLLQHRNDLTFVVCGEGPNRAALVAAAGALPNIQFHDLQPREELSELLGLATVHLLPQLASAADLVLPSKLTNMLASGRPIVATAATGTGLYTEVEGCGLIVPPGNASTFARAIETIIDDPTASVQLGVAARARAEERWSRSKIFGRFMARLADQLPSR